MKQVEYKNKEVEQAKVALEEKAEQMMREHLRETCQHVVEQFYPGMLQASSSK